jgi:hypothetical protein
MAGEKKEAQEHHQDGAGYFRSHVSPASLFSQQGYKNNSIHCTLVALIEGESILDVSIASFARDQESKPELVGM